MGKAVAKGIESKVWTRADLVLSTKLFFGDMVPEDHKDFVQHRKRINRVGLSRKHIVEGMKASLKRMNVCTSFVYCFYSIPLFIVGVCGSCVLSQI